jgi:hypothetical protein
MGEIRRRQVDAGGAASRLRSHDNRANQHCDEHAFFFGYSFTSWPLLRAGLALAAVVPIALAADTFSITVMEIVDNAILLVIPGAMEAGLGDILFWASLAFALAVAWVAAFPVNRYLIARGRGHAVAHAHHAHH